MQVEHVTILGPLFVKGKNGFYGYAIPQNYDGAGRLISARHNDLLRRYATDPAGNRITDREQSPALPPVWRDNRIGEDVQYFYHHDEHGRLVEKDERQPGDGGSHSHHYHYDNQHRLCHYRCEQQGGTLLESRYLYDPLGRRIGKRVWKSQRYEDGSRTRPEITESVWYGWDGDRLTTTETDTQRIQTIYLPGSFTPLVRIETETAELLKAARRTLAEKFQQEANVTFPPELVVLVDSLEAELQRGELSEASRTWLAQCGLTPEQIQNQIEPEYTPQRKIHRYHCDHRGLPLALVNQEGKADWSAEYDAWGNVLRENNPHNIEQHIRLPGQQYDEETGLYYNRHRYYDPSQGRYITQDPIGLKGGLNPYAYPLNPITEVDPLGLIVWMVIPGVCAAGGCEAILVGLGLSASIAGQQIQAGSSNGGEGVGTTSNTNVYDKSGAKVSPYALTMQPPGNCDPYEQKKMQEEVDGWCKGKQTPTSCKGIKSPSIRSAIAEVNRQCGIARDKINKQCFAGGDLTHRNQAIDAWKKYSECME